MTYIFVIYLFLLFSDQDLTPTACKECEIWQSKYEASQDRIQALQQRVSALSDSLLEEKAMVRRLGGEYDFRL